MAKIKDYHESKPKRAGATYTWVWEVVTDEWDDYSGDFCEKTVAYFFDPWKAVKYGMEMYNVGCGVKALMLHTDNLTDEKGVK